MWREIYIANCSKNYRLGRKYSNFLYINNISIKLIRIESLHKAGFIHRDIKPNNFVMGLPGSSNHDTVYMIDFGLSKAYRDSKTHIHYPKGPPSKSLTGTARYASINSHHGMSKSND